MDIGAAPPGSAQTPAWQHILRQLRSGDFLGRERLLAYGSLICALYATIALILWMQADWLVDADGFPIQSDFLNVWAAGFLAVGGEAAAIYDWAAHKQAQIAAMGRDFEGYLYWLYPPMFLFVAAPLSLLPYVTAWLVWIAVGLSMFVASLRLVLPVPGVVVGAVAAPTTLFCALTGQNGLFTAALMAGALALLDRRPWFSGVFLGLLTYKPQYGALFPLVLLLTRRWEAFLAAAVAAVAFAGASALAFGAEVWAAFFGSMSASVNDVLRKGGAEWFKLQSVYAFSYQVTENDAVSWAVHCSASLAFAAAVVAVWLREATLAVKAAALIAASYLVTPYAYIYDAVVLTVGAVFLVKDGVERGFGPFDKALLCFCQLLPGLFFLGALHSLIAPAAALLLLLLALRRAAPRSMRREPLPHRPARA